MRIIALRGGRSCGKTTTINLVYDKIISLGGIPTGRRQVGGDKYDFEDLVKYKHLNVAFYSMGDLSYCTIDVIKKYDGLSVDVLIIASNIKFVKPIKLIMKYSNNLITKTIASPCNTSNNLVANTADANYIFSLI